MLSLCLCCTLTTAIGFLAQLYQEFDVFPVAFVGTFAGFNDELSAGDILASW